MNKKLTFLFIAALTAASFGGETMAFQGSENIKFMGRWNHEKNRSCASAPSAYIQFNANAKSVSFDLEGDVRWRFDIDNKPVVYFTTSERTVKKLAAASDGESHSYRLIKVSESNPGEACLYSVSLAPKGVFGAKPKDSNRRIEFIGDSFTVGFGNEGSISDDESKVFEKTDGSKGYAFLLADGFKADFQVNAVSGRGLVRNYANIVPEWPLEKLYDLTEMGIAGEPNRENAWDFGKFHPQVIVVFVGINDFQGEPPYADKAQFKAAYARLLEKLRQQHPGVKFLLVSTKVWPNDDLTPTVQSIYDEEIAQGRKDVEFKVLKTENQGMLGHPNVYDHGQMANALRPILGRLGGWLSR